MASFNRVTLIGNLTRDPQVKVLPSNMTIAEFGVAMNRKFKTAGGEDREEVVFVDVAAFARQAEIISQYFHKGDPIFIEGRLKFDQWEDKQGGGKRSKLSVVCDNFQFLKSREGGEGGGQPSGNGGGQQRQQPAGKPQGGGRKPARPQQDAPFGDEQQFKEADIPF